jgi:hypothetical protein
MNVHVVINSKGGDCLKNSLEILVVIDVNPWRVIFEIDVNPWRVILEIDVNPWRSLEPLKMWTISLEIWL